MAELDHAELSVTSDVHPNRAFIVSIPQCALGWQLQEGVHRNMTPSESMQPCPWPSAGSPWEASRIARWSADGHDASASAEQTWLVFKRDGLRTHPRIHPKLRRLTRKCRCFGGIPCAVKLLKVKVRCRLTRKRSNTTPLLFHQPTPASRQVGAGGSGVADSRNLGNRFGMGTRTSHLKEAWQNWGIFWGRFIHAGSHFPNKFEPEAAMQ